MLEQGLKQRITTALILLAVVLLALVASNPVYWQALTIIITLVALWEWLGFCQISTRWLVILAYIALLGLTAILHFAGLPIQNIVFISVALWLILLLFTFCDQPAVLHKPLLKLIVGIWVLAVSAYLLYRLKLIPHGELWILMLLAITSFADIGAYFTGKRFGKHKLAPLISPGKTIEGLIGGLCLVVLLFIIAWLSLSLQRLLPFTILVVITTLISVAGDLFESKLKRHVDLKDSSQILPGHGGLLDRIDSLIAALPFFVAGLILLGVL